MGLLEIWSSFQESLGEPSFWEGTFKPNFELSRTCKGRLAATPCLGIVRRCTNRGNRENEAV